MKIKSVNTVNEAKKFNIEFKTSIEDQFPYIESIISTLDSNYNFWKSKAKELEAEIISIIRKNNVNDISIQTRLILVNMTDQKVSSVKWTGPAFEFTINNVNIKVIDSIKKSLGDMWNGHKVIMSGEKIVVLFG